MAKVKEKNIPLYAGSIYEAKIYGEMKEYQLSRETNFNCARAIEAIIDGNTDPEHLSAQGAKDIIDRFGPARVSYVLAYTLQMRGRDGRFSQNNKSWAWTVDTHEPAEHKAECVVHSHPAELNLFIDQARHEILLRTPLTQAEIKAEAERILSEFQKLPEANSPDGARFMVALTPEFLVRAKAKDHSRLLGIMPFSDIAISQVKGREGMYVQLAKGEDRNQTLSSRKSSIRRQLAKTPASTNRGKAAQNDREAR